MKLRDWTVDLLAQTAEHKSGFVAYLELGEVVEILEFDPGNLRRLRHLCRDAARAYRLVRRFKRRTKSASASRRGVPVAE